MMLSIGIVVALAWAFAITIAHGDIGESSLSAVLASLQSAVAAPHNGTIVFTGQNLPTPISLITGQTTVPAATSSTTQTISEVSAIATVFSSTKHHYTSTTHSSTAVTTMQTPTPTHNAASSLLPPALIFLGLYTNPLWSTIAVVYASIAFANAKPVPLRNYGLSRTTCHVPYCISTCPDGTLINCCLMHDILDPCMDHAPDSVSKAWARAHAARVLDIQWNYVHEALNLRDIKMLKEAANQLGGKVAIPNASLSEETTALELKKRGINTMEEIYVVKEGIKHLVVRAAAAPALGGLSWGTLGGLAAIIALIGVFWAVDT